MKGITSLRTRFLAVLAAICLVVAGLSLVACGGGATSGSASAGSSAASSAASSASSAADPTAKFVGSWKMAAAESQGVVMAGDLANILGVEGGIAMTVNADGTASMSYGSDSVNMTWAAEGTDAIKMTVKAEGSASSSTPETLSVTYKDGALQMPFDVNGEKSTIIFTTDGVYANAKPIALSDAKPITSDSQLLGTWQIAGMNMAGVSMYGDAAGFASVMGSDDMTFVFKEGGVFQMGSSQGTWAITSEGATVTVTDTSGTFTLPVLAYGDGLAMDYSATIGGTELIVVMTKA